MSSSAELPVPEADPVRVRDAAADILSGAEYRPRPRSIVEQMLDFVGDLLAELAKLGTGQGAGGALGALVAMVVVAGVGWVLVAVVRRRVGTTSGAIARTVPPVVVIDERDARGWMAEADRLERAGDRRGAVRALHRALVLRLSEATAADADAVADGRDQVATTAHEVLDVLVTRAPELRDGLEDLTRRFERAYYGDLEISDREVGSYREAGDRLVGVTTTGSSR